MYHSDLVGITLIICTAIPHASIRFNRRVHPSSRHIRHSHLPTHSPLASRLFSRLPCHIFRECLHSRSQVKSQFSLLQALHSRSQPKKKTLLSLASLPPKSSLEITSIAPSLFTLPSPSADLSSSTSSLWLVHHTAPKRAARSETLLALHPSSTTSTQLSLVSRKTHLPVPESLSTSITWVSGFCTMRRGASWIPGESAEACWV